MQTILFSTPLGTLKITATEIGICSVLYCDERAEDISEISGSTLLPVLKECSRQMSAYFTGKLKQFSLPLDLESVPSTEFQRKIWNLLVQIPYGITISYAELSVRYGDLKATRAVGHANGQNRINIIIPCHRVIGSDGKLTGYGGGLWRKEWLLRFEKANTPEGLFGEMNI